MRSTTALMLRADRNDTATFPPTAPLPRALAGDDDSAAGELSDVAAILVSSEPPKLAPSLPPDAEPPTLTPRSMARAGVDRTATAVARERIEFSFNIGPLVQLRWTRSSCVALTDGRRGCQRFVRDEVIAALMHFLR